MSLSQQVEYKNKSIDSLVQQLANLGNSLGLTHQTQLMAIQTREIDQLRRFQTKSLPARQFFKLDQNDKKYFYDYMIGHKLSSQNLCKFLQNYHKNGHNCTIILENDMQDLSEILNCLNLQQNMNNYGVFCSLINIKNQVFDVFGQYKYSYKNLMDNRKYYQLCYEQIIEYLGQLGNQDNKNRINSNIQSYNNICYNNPSNSFITLTFKNLSTYAQLNIFLIAYDLLFPLNSLIQIQDLSIRSQSQGFNLIRNQLFQILNYIKINPSKRYSHISNLITKRHPITNYFTKILMNDTCNLVVNFVKKQIKQNNQRKQKKQRRLNEILEFYQKIKLIVNILKRPQRNLIEIGVKKSIQQKQQKLIKHAINVNNMNNQKKDNDNNNNKDSYSKTIAKNIKSIYEKQKQQINESQKPSPINKINRNTQESQQNQQQRIVNEQNFILEQKQFRFCRSLERKTHKFSISPDLQDKGLGKQNNLMNIKDKKTISKYNEEADELIDQYIQQKPSLSGNNQTQQIFIIKAQHAREVSQYHQTIQNLNKKIFILTKQRNLEQLYQIHQREIMLLELKIKQLRNDVIQLGKQDLNQTSLRQIIRRLNEEINKNGNNINRKVAQGRILMLQKEMKEIKDKLSISEKARSHLTLEVQSLTKRLKIRDSQISQINEKQIQKYNQLHQDELSLSQEELLQSVKKLIKAVWNQQRNSQNYLIQKVSLILSDISKSRDIILQCNDFLVQLMDILEDRMSSKIPQIVLDCNKFIRSFLIQNLSIF